MRSYSLYLAAVWVNQYMRDECRSKEQWQCAPITTSFLISSRLALRPPLAARKDFSHSFNSCRRTVAISSDVNSASDMVLVFFTSFGRFEWRSGRVARSESRSTTPPFRGGKRVSCFPQFAHFGYFPWRDPEFRVFHHMCPFSWDSPAYLSCLFLLTATSVLFAPTNCYI